MGTLTCWGCRVLKRSWACRLKLVEVLFGDAGSDQHLDGADLLRKQLLLKDLQDKIAASGLPSPLIPRFCLASHLVLAISLVFCHS